MSAPEPPASLVERLSPLLHGLGPRRTVAWSEISASTVQKCVDFKRDSADLTIIEAVGRLREACDGMAIVAHRVICAYVVTIDAELVRIDVWGNPK